MLEFRYDWQRPNFPTCWSSQGLSPLMGSTPEPSANRKGNWVWSLRIKFSILLAQPIFPGLTILSSWDPAVLASIGTECEKLKRKQTAHQSVGWNLPSHSPPPSTQTPRRQLEIGPFFFPKVTFTTVPPGLRLAAPANARPWWITARSGYCSLHNPI